MAQELNPNIAKRVASMQRPTAGQSLTNSPDNPQAFERAPEYTDMTKALDFLFDDLTEDEERYEAVMDAVESHMPIMDITKLILYDGFQKGKWNPDLLMVLAEPLSYIIMGLAERANIDYVIVSTDEDEDDDVEPVGLARLDQSMRETEPSEESLPPEIKEKVASAEVPERPQEGAEVPERPQEGQSLLGEQ